MRKGAAEYRMLGYIRMLKGFLFIKPEAEPIAIIGLGVLKQYLAGFCHVAVNLPLCFWINHFSRSLTVRAGQAWRSAKQPADQRALTVYLTAVLAKIRAVVFGQRRVMLSIGFNWQSSDLFGRGRYGAATVVASRRAFEARNTFPEKTDYLTVVSHATALF